MWLLSHDGDLTGGKRLWLRPGTSHLLGRSHDSGSDFSIYVDAKTVSRKHLVLTVRDVPPGAARRLDARSEVVLRDSSKFGTVLDGERFTDAEKVVGGEGDEREVHVVGLGKWDVAWRLTWHPVVITTSGKKKSRKKDGDAVDIVDKLEPLDIKVVPDYLSEITTHVVSAKRNTPKALQALINGRYVVDEPWVVELESKAMVNAQGEDGESLSRAPLEEDFDGNWPKEMDYVPPTGLEPKERPAELWAPNPERETVFSGYTFIFSNSRIQFDQLGPVVMQGTGKALVKAIEPGSDDVDGFVQYVKNATREDKAKIVVRIAEPQGQDEGWWMKFYNAVDPALGQRSINQNDFLDAIVMNDASLLRQRLRPEEEGEEIPSSIPGPPPSTSASRFKGFDDFDPNELPKTQYVSDDDAMQDSGPSELQSQHPEASQTRNRATRGKKRQHEDQAAAIEISDGEDQEAAVDKLFPATTAMKRRKLEQQMEEAAIEDIPEARDSPRRPKKPSIVAPKPQEEKEINVIQLAKERREKEDEERRKDEESLREAMKDLDVESMKNLAKVEEMEIRSRSERTGDTEEQDGDEHWKTEWNGRKNFKKFRKRRAGDQDGESQAPLRSRKVIVALEEVKHDEITLEDDDDSFFDDIAFNSGRSRLGSRHGDSQTSSHHADRTARGTSRLPPSEHADSDDDAVFTRTGAGRRSASASQGSGPAKAISLRPGADAELHDLDPAEIAGQPRSESIAAARDAQRPGTASSTRSKATSVAPGSARSRGSPAPSSQTLAGDGATQQQRPGSSASAASTAATRGKRGAMGPPAGGKEPPAKKGVGRNVKPVKLGAGLGKPESEGESDEGSGDELRFRRRRR
ncbi:hypothetical protein SLS56_004053 [Neofusicoccum ribis]|uniref:FHA domain-containing protein n=1 Tax=Neofusicoccum ribis TaxID=45134 RepID=A0ABR3SXD1_9PEZI